MATLHKYEELFAFHQHFVHLVYNSCVHSGATRALKGFRPKNGKVNNCSLTRLLAFLGVCERGISISVPVPPGELQHKISHPLKVEL